MCPICNEPLSRIYAVLDRVRADDGYMGGTIYALRRIAAGAPD